jgi:hypothetical protein
MTEIFHKQKHFRLTRGLAADFERICSLLGIHEREAAEQALAGWVKQNNEEAQKKLDLYAERGITIIQPETVTITQHVVFQKAEILLAKEELNRRLEILEHGNPDCRHDTQLELAQALKKIQPVYVHTRDPELLELLNKAKTHLVDRP